MPRPTKQSLSFLFPHQNPVCISLHHAFHRPCIPIIFYFCFYVTVYFQYRQHLKAIRHIFRWNRFLWIHLSIFRLITTSLGLGVFLTSRTATQFWQYDNFDSFLGVLDLPECGFIQQRTGFIWLRTWIRGRFCGNGDELSDSIKEVKLLTSITTNARSFQEKYALRFLCLRSTSDHAHTKLPIILLFHSQIHQFSKDIKTKLHIKWLHNFQFKQTTNQMQQFPVYYPDVYLQLNMFRALSRPSSAAQWLQWQAATAVIELLMMGGTTPETCWAVDKRQDNKLENCCICLFELYDDARTCKPKKKKQFSLQSGRVPQGRRWVAGVPL